jgi:DNA-binding NtrC family response regulator
MSEFRSLVILLLDPDGQRSPLGSAVRRAGHRLVIATGIETAEIVLGTLTPDVVMVRALTPDRDRANLARLERMAPEVPVRIIDAPGAVDEAYDAAAAVN